MFFLLFIIFFIYWLYWMRSFVDKMIENTYRNVFETNDYERDAVTFIGCRQLACCVDHKDFKRMKRTAQKQR